MTTETTTAAIPGTSNLQTTVAAGEAIATTAASVAGLATGNPEIVPLTVAAEALVNAIMNIQQASSATGTMTQAQLAAQWQANATALGVALAAFKAAK